ncbi:IclR family transcriptional regulator [Nocardia sp. CA-135398]|uniref:IclR family transcriptional regulator n=1 Tax=Nocardia sp. CA-135398 TaxID=3239977 RepID=UPI003D9532A9
MTSALSRTAEYVITQPGPPPSMAERITVIMDVFERPSTVRTLEQVALRTHLPRSTTYRILEQLARLRWLDRTATGYRLGERSLGLGGREPRQSGLRAAAAPILHDLAVRTKLVVHLAVLDGPEVYYLDKVASPAAIDVPSRVGGRAPAHCTALGKAMLARLTPERIDVQYATGVPVCTASSIGDIGRLHAELGRIRSGSGAAHEFGEFVPGLGCVAVALRSPEGSMGAISVASDTQSVLQRVAPLVAHAARAITDELIRTAIGPAPHQA